MNAAAEFEPVAGVSASKGPHGRWLLALAVVAVATALALRQSGAAAIVDDPASTPSTRQLVAHRAWLGAVAPTARGLDPDWAAGRTLDLVLVRAPHEDVLQWFRRGGAKVEDEVAGRTVDVGSGNALLVRFAGQRWTTVFEPSRARPWLPKLSRELHVPVLWLQASPDAGPLAYVLYDDGVVVERFAATSPPTFTSTRRAPPSELTADREIVDALLRDLDAFAPAVAFDDCCRALDAGGWPGRARIEAPAGVEDFGAGPVRRQFVFAHCSWLAW